MCTVYRWNKYGAELYYLCVTYASEAILLKVNKSIKIHTNTITHTALIRSLWREPSPVIKMNGRDICQKNENGKSIWNTFYGSVDVFVVILFRFLLILFFFVYVFGQMRKLNVIKKPPLPSSSPPPPSPLTSLHMNTKWKLKLCYDMIIEMFQLAFWRKFLGNLNMARRNIIYI